MRIDLLSLTVAFAVVLGCDRGARITPAAPPGPTDVSSDATPRDEGTDESVFAGIPGEGGELVAELATTKGDLRCVLHQNKTPLAVENFVGLARGKKAWVDPQTGTRVQRPLYDGLPFHRIVTGFAVQTGDPTGTGRGGPGFEFRDEFRGDLRHDGPGVMSMANHGPNTNGSQFFITLGAAPHLDGRHTVFGRCEPTDVLEALGSVEVEGDRPLEPPLLTEVRFSRR